MRDASWPGRTRPLRYTHRHRLARSSASRSPTALRCSDSSKPEKSTPRATFRSGYVATGRARRNSAGKQSRASRASLRTTCAGWVSTRSCVAPLRRVGGGPVFLSVDVDVLDPAFAPGTGTPEPGGLTSAELLQACRQVAEDLQLVGAEVVEVIPTTVGSADITALVADRIVREILTGIALRRRRYTTRCAWRCAARPSPRRRRSPR